MIEVAIILTLVAYLYWAWPRLLKRHLFPDATGSHATVHWDDYDNHLTPAERQQQIADLDHLYEAS